MGHGIVYCGECGKLLREDDFVRRRAQTIEARPYCGECRPLPLTPPPAAAGPGLKKLSSQRIATVTSRIPAQKTDSSSREARRWALAGGALAGFAVLVMVILLASGSGGPGGSNVGAPPPPAPRTDPSAELAALKAAEARLLEAQRLAEDERRLNELLEEARAIREGDPTFSRTSDVLYRLAQALDVAGPRRSEVERLRVEYERAAVAAAASRRRLGPYALEGPGYVEHWLILGPFPNDLDQGLYQDFLNTEETHEPGRGGEVAAAGGRTLRWEPAVAPKGQLNFFKVQHLKLADKQSDVVNYAACWLECEEPQDVEIRLGTDDGFRLWVDGRIEITRHVHRGMAEDQDRVGVSLGKGMHRILLKVDQGQSAHGFVVKIVTPDGRKPGGIRVWN